MKFGDERHSNNLKTIKVSTANHAVQMTVNENNAFDHTLLYSVACPAICPLVLTVNGLIDIHASRMRNNQCNENIPPVGGPIGLLV